MPDKPMQRTDYFEINKEAVMRAYVDAFLASLPPSIRDAPGEQAYILVLATAASAGFIAAMTVATS